MSTLPFTMRRGHKQRGKGIPTHSDEEAQLTFAGIAARYRSR